MLYRHHYMRDIETNFPDVALAEFLVCPQLPLSTWKLALQ